MLYLSNEAEIKILEPKNCSDSNFGTLLWVPATPAKYIFVWSLFVTCHSHKKLDPKSATPFSVSVLIFALRSKGGICQSR